MQDPAAYYQTMMAKQQQQQQPEFAEQEQLKCPRCDSPNTKFCYYNNYNLSQPRHFCKSCRRYWTKGGALRNVPVGGGSRKNATKRSTSSVSSSSSPSNNTHHNKKTKNPDPDPSNSQNPDLVPTTQKLYGFPIGDQDVKGMEIGGSFSSLLASSMQLGLGGGGIMLDGSGWDMRRTETGNSANPWTDLAMNRVEKKTELRREG